MPRVKGAKKKRGADIFRDRNTGDIVVIGESGIEVFRRPESPQIISIANAIYFSAKYGNRTGH